MTLSQKKWGTLMALKGAKVGKPFDPETEEYL